MVSALLTPFFGMQAESWKSPVLPVKENIVQEKTGGLGSFWAANCGGAPRLSNFGLPIVAGVPGLGNSIA